MDSGSGVYIHEGVKWNNGTDIYYISSTGSAFGSDGVNNDYWNRWKEALKHATNDISSEEGSWYMSGSDPAANQATLYFTGSLTASAGQNLAFSNSSVSLEKTGNEIYINSSGASGFGMPVVSGNPSYSNQTLVFANGGGSNITFELVFPFNGYAPAGSNIGVRATGAFASTVTALSAAIASNTPNYTILYHDSISATEEKFTIKAGPTGSIYNSDLSTNSPFFTITQNMSGGYDTFNAIDDNWLFISHTGSDNYLFRLDNNEFEPTMKSDVTHTFTTSVANGVYNIAGETVTGSVIAATEVPSIVMVEGSIYKFMQEKVKNIMKM